MAPENTDKVILRSPADWPRWFAIVRAKATYRDVWEYVNPDVTPDQATPVKPVLAQGATETQIKLHLVDSKQWRNQMTAIDAINNYVLQTLGPYFGVVETYNTLQERVKALKEHVAPTDYTRRLEIEQAFDSLRLGPARNQKVLNWLDEWETTVQQTTTLNVTTITAGLNATRTFLLAIRRIDPS